MIVMVMAEANLLDGHGGQDGRTQYQGECVDRHEVHHYLTAIYPPSLLDLVNTKKGGPAMNTKMYQSKPSSRNWELLI